MRNFGRWALVGLFAVGGAGFSSAARADEHERGHKHTPVTLDEIPTAARSALEKEAGGRQLRELRKEQHKGKTIFEGEFVTGKTGHTIEVSSDGKVLERSTHDESRETEENER